MVRLSKPFIKLPFRFDVAQLTHEAEQFSNESWMVHPNNLKGNSAVALVSKQGGDNNDFDGAKAITPHLERCEYIQQVMAHFGQVLSRSRLMKLDAGCEVSTHVDFNYHWYNRVRIHIPIITTPEVIFYCGSEQIHMSAGDCWIFDSWRRHQVINKSHINRIHLVIDTCGSSAFWDLVANMEQLSTQQIDEQSQLIAFQSRKKVQLLLEQYSSLPVMSPGECDGLIDDLIVDFTNNPNNEKALVKRYTRILKGFAQDWRILWSLYGYQVQGFERYRQLIQSTRQQLHPNMRAITTASNDIGVNAIFTQRVLNAALNMEERQRLLS